MLSPKSQFRQSILDNKKDDIDKINQFDLVFLCGEDLITEQNRIEKQYNPQRACYEIEHWSQLISYVASHFAVHRKLTSQYLSLTSGDNFSQSNFYISREFRMFEQVTSEFRFDVLRHFISIFTMAIHDAQK
jgi:hypothetical protein